MFFITHFSPQSKLILFTFRDLTYLLFLLCSADQFHFQERKFSALPGNHVHCHLHIASVRTHMLCPNWRREWEGDSTPGNYSEPTVLSVQ